MSTTITLPAHLVVQLQERAKIEHRSVEALAIAYITTGLLEPVAPSDAPPRADLREEDDPELRAVVARIKALLPNPASSIAAQGNLATVLRVLEATPDATADLNAEIAALQSAEEELRMLNQADDLAEGRR